MKKWPALLILCGYTLVAACSRQPRSEDYFSAHLDEARHVVDGCRNGSVRGEECSNADYAVKLADAEAMRDRFFMKDR